MKPTSVPIVITGAGVVSAIGLNQAETLRALQAGRSGIGPVRYLATSHRELPVGEVPLSDAELRARLGIPVEEPTVRTALLGMVALEEALQQARLTRDDLPEMAFISGTTVGGMDRCEQYYKDFLTGDAHREYIALHDCGASTELIADHFGRFALVTTPSTACSSAANALILGAELIRSGAWERVVVGGSESLSKFHLNGFNTLMILDHEPCRPFDAERAGLNLGEGAGYLVLETETSAQRRGVPPLARLSGYGNACDAFHQTATSADGEGAYRAMKQALERAGLQPADVDYINAHGTGTPNNDASECTAMQRLFGTAVPPFSSTKGYTGHTTSASGAVEAVFCLLTLAHQFLPANLRWAHLMPEGLKPVTDERPGRPVRHVLCNAFGFGGNDSSMLFSAL
jgi:3-oxoacyl-[acyl-carrier-protein] synthase-1